MALNSRWVHCLVWTYLLYLAACSSSGSDNTGTNGDTVDGGMLVDLGRRMRQPLLTLIGMAVRNQHPCSEWTQWSSCTATRTGYFGTRNRTRTCIDIDSVSLDHRTEEDFRVCEGFCPRNYNFTESNYCLKIFNMTVTWDDAENTCQNDGGNLVYIEGDAKFSEIKKMLDGFVSNAWIDGRRKDTSSPWTTVHGVLLTKFYWYSSQPSNGSDELCIVLSSSNSREWHDVFCNSKRFPLCEIKQ